MSLKFFRASTSNESETACPESDVPPERKVSGSLSRALALSRAATPAALSGIATARGVRRKWEASLA